MLMLPFAIKNKSKGNSQEYKEYNKDTFEDSPQHKRDLNVERTSTRPSNPYRRHVTQTVVQRAL